MITNLQNWNTAFGLIYALASILKFHFENCERLLSLMIGADGFAAVLSSDLIKVKAFVGLTAQVSFGSSSIHPL